MNEKLVSIGEMARLYDISTQTLRYYDKMGLLKPVYINEESGYRYYSLRQCLSLDVILYLKHVGTPLEEIVALIKGNHSIEKLREILKSNKVLVEKKIKELQTINNLLNTKLDQLCKIENVQNFGEVYIKHINQKTALVAKAEKPGYYSEKPEYLKDVHYAGRVLTGMIEKYDYSGIECEWGFYGRFGHLEKDKLPKYEGYFAITNNNELEQHYKENIEILPEGDYVCITYKGKMLANKQVYQRIYDYVEEHDITLGGFFYDATLFTGYLTDNRDDYIMDIKFLMV